MSSVRTPGCTPTDGRLSLREVARPSRSARARQLGATDRARSSYRCLRLGVNLGLLHHTWIDGQRGLPARPPVEPLVAELRARRACAQRADTAGRAMARRHLQLIGARTAGRSGAGTPRRSTGRRVQRSWCRPSVGKLGLHRPGDRPARWHVDPPPLLAGASMGSILSAFRAQPLVSGRVRHRGDGAGARASLWRLDAQESLFDPGDHPLDAAERLGPFFRNEDGFGMRLGDTAIPLRIVVSGLVGAPPRSRVLSILARQELDRSLGASWCSISPASPQSLSSATRRSRPSSWAATS